ncbi:MAG: LytTR family DNA-binding domain-containing protein [Parasphingorhabdus sp.]|uniref:LytTR family DNA-binding domain-containing protein n=1 Tax=Parasphingorhabdus sp. TaxID=2709688 RepID=UPI00329A5C0D
MSDIRTRWSLKWIAVELLVMALIGLVFGFLGPFGTYAMPLALRLAYWVGFILIGYAIFRPVSISANWLREAVALPAWGAEALATAVAALPLTFLIGFAISGMRFDADFFGDRFLGLYIQCALIGFGIFLFMRLLFDSNETEPVQPSETQPSAPPPPPAAVKFPLRDRLPSGFADPVIALGVEDHYVRVYSSSHSEMLLLRLSDAIREIEPLEGMQVHRSWWVARNAIEKTKREGRNLRLVLNSGLEVPVSRAYVTKLKQLGWI